jgi:hypothetical protein
LQRLGVRLEVTEAVLNHVSGSRGGIVGVYQRYDYAEEKRAALTDWGRRLTEIVDGRQADRGPAGRRQLGPRRDGAVARSVTDPSIARPTSPAPHP